jgi:acyl carrier protein
MVITLLEMKQFIIDTLGLEGLTPEGIGDEDPLFAGGLGLDSIDALELGIALRKRFQIQAAEQDPTLKDHFRTVRSLVEFVAQYGKDLYDLPSLAGPSGL